MSKDQGEKTFEKQRLERLAELNSLSKVPEGNKAAVDAMLRDKITDRKDQYTPFARKTGGVTEGGVFTQEQIDGKSHAHLLKKTKHITKDNQELINRRDNVNEFVMAGLYQRLLYDRASKTEITKSSDPKDEIFTRIKFFNNFQTLSEFTGADPKMPGDIKSKDPKLQEIKGFEKAIAACMLGGELDYHAGNLGVITTQDDKGKDVYTVAKIDHGRSAMLKYSDEQDLRWNLAVNFKGFGYNKIPFDIPKFKEALDEMNKISPEEIKTIVASRIQKLKDADFKIEDIPFDTYTQGKSQTLRIPKPHNSERNKINYNKLEKHYVDIIENNLQATKELSKTLDLIQKIDIPDKVPNKISKIGGQDPIEFALNEDLKINKQHPIEFAAKNKLKIEGQDPIQYAIKNKLDINGKSAVDLVEELKNNKKETLIDVAIKNNTKIGGQDPIDFAINNGHKIQNQDPVEWIIKSSIPDKEIKLQNALNKHSINSLNKLLSDMKKDSHQNKEVIDIIDKHRQKLESDKISKTHDHKNTPININKEDLKLLNEIKKVFDGYRTVKNTPSSKTNIINQKNDKDRGI